MKQIRKSLPIILILFLLCACNSSPEIVEKEADDNSVVGEIVGNSEQIVELDTNQLYLDFLKNQGLGVGKSNVFFLREDIDLNGYEEAIAAFGSTTDYFDEIYILRNRDGRIVQLGDNLSNEAYAVNEIKLIHLEDREELVVYLGLTNFINMSGFKLISVTGNNLIELVNSTSPTGTGIDELIDTNQNGKYDGYVQQRHSFDVLYYPVTRTFTLQEGEFKVTNTFVELGDYPSDPRRVVLEYLTLGVIVNPIPAEAARRLEELCPICLKPMEEIVPEIKYETVYQLIMRFDEVSLDTDERGNTATVTVTLVDDNRRVFQLVKNEQKWAIHGTELLEPATIEQALIGTWQDGEMVAAGYRNLYIFKNDMTFEFTANSMDCAKRELGYSGKWEANSDDTITLKIDRKLTFEGGDLEKSTGSCGSEYELVGATLVVENLNILEELTIQLSPVAEQDHKNPFYFSMHFNDIQYWKLYDGALVSHEEFIEAYREP